MSTITEGSTDESGVRRDVVSLEVGDEVYAFEKYTQEETKQMIYGTEVCTSHLPPVTWSTSSDPTSSSSAKPVKTEEPEQVFIGIFPASLSVMSSDAEGRLPDLTTLLNGSVSVQTQAQNPLASTEKEQGNQAKSTRAALVVYPASIRSVQESENIKPLPPRPSLKSGDDTASGTMQPIIDEIASALREWHSMTFQHLARCDYKLFHTVREHIEVLRLGRRQLLLQTSSAEETISLRRDCFARLVSGNAVQELDIIVRHPTWGARWM
ncbi:hypothetical protein DEU56DRAFT_945760 [Suillus clintonianus]|uniref:uncharacterized protein n=1 Tax=Suillus clintonianus TaxID=1904413 RepID=UPI001B882B95|nr:uncharacterized protein DEU56DRAFT_945760 [Suillus clintonianus]KAG2137993.1 hypothetical protein DEU56DRAFT_945760 [Suillus clintonianus]